VRLGDLVIYKPRTQDWQNPDGKPVMGVVIAGTGDGEITKIMTPCGTRYWAITKHCEVISESR